MSASLPGKILHLKVELTIVVGRKLALFTMAVMFYDLIAFNTRKLGKLPQNKCIKNYASIPANSE